MWVSLRTISSSTSSQSRHSTSSRSTLLWTAFPLSISLYYSHFPLSSFVRQLFFAPPPFLSPPPVVAVGWLQNAWHRAGNPSPCQSLLLLRMRLLTHTHTHAPPSSSLPPSFRRVQAPVSVQDRHHLTATPPFISYLHLSSPFKPTPPPLPPPGSNLPLLLPFIHSSTHESHASCFYRLSCWKSFLVGSFTKHRLSIV